MKMNPRQLEKMARKMGMQMDEIDATEVIIRTPTKNIIINNPSVAKVNMMGQETFQISGTVSEESVEDFSDDDVEMIADQAGVSYEEAEAALKETKDIAEAIMKLKK